MNNDLTIFTFNSPLQLPPGAADRFVRMTKYNERAVTVFRQEAQKYLANPASHHKGLVYQALAQQRWPLELAYLMPSYSLASDHDKFGGNFLNIDGGRILKLRDRLAEMVTVNGVRGDAPLSENGKALLDSSSLFHRVVQHPDYWPTFADRKIKRDNIESYAQDAHGANIVCLCIGNGINAAEHYQHVRQNGAEPELYIINDIDPLALSKAKDNLIASGIPAGKIVMLPGDIHTDEFWEQPIWKKLRESPLPTLVELDGATYNDFTAPHQRKLMSRFGRRGVLKPGSKIDISIDSTQTGLNKGYGYNEVRQWLMPGFVHSLWLIGLDVDPSHIDVRVEYKQRQDHAAIMPMIVNTKDQLLKKKIGGETVSYVLPAGKIPTVEVRKLDAWVPESQALHGEVDIVGLRPFVDASGKFDHVQMNRWRFETPRVAVYP